MDISTPLGIVVGLAAVMIAMVLDGGNPASLVAPSAILLVIGGTIGVSLAGVRLADIKNVIGALKAAIMAKKSKAEETVAALVRFAEMARREGVLALEAATRDLDDLFLKKGMQLIIDGVDGERIREILDADVESMRSRHRQGAKFFKDMAGFAPTLGILGTVMGLIHVLANLSNPSTLGPAISAAFTATLWGVMTANVIWLPISNKLAHLAEHEYLARLLIVDGVLAIQSGSSPRLLEQQLLTYLAPDEREQIEAKREHNKEAPKGKGKAA
ncbi:MAG: flagellar motor protein [Ferrimicrobium sp.]